MKKTIVNIHDLVNTATVNYIATNAAAFKSTVAGPQGIAGAAGTAGTNGVNGKSAYQIWLALGNTGSEIDFINSLIGTDGHDGVDGMSAYDIWLYEGNVGDEAAFLTSLRGPRGFAGQSVHHTSYTRSKNSLGEEIGATEPGVPGNTDIYTVWDGQEEYSSQWLGEFKVTNGDSAYAHAVKNGYVGTESEYYNLLISSSTVLATLSDLSDEVTAASAQVAADKVIVEGAKNTATTFASSASSSATAASVSAASASSNATTASTKASEASTSAASALTSKNAASTSASEALTSKNAAAASATTATAAKNAAELALDQFTDLYLGIKTVDPTVDNDGNALIDGAMYFNTSSNTMKVYDVGTTTWYSIPQIYLSSLLDVDLTSITTGDILRWNGIKWINYTLPKADLLFDKPSKGPLFIKVSPSSIKIPAGLKLTVGAESFKVVSDYTLTLASNLLVPGTKTAGTDYYVYAKANGTFYISSNKNITTDRLIGGFHYSLVGETEAATGNKTEADMVKIRGINAYSFWDLKYRPVANSEGMVCIGKKWYDIYLLNSEHITNGTSKAGATIAAGVTQNGRTIPKIPLEYGGNGTLTYGKFTWFQACEIAKAHNKQLISYAEFPTIAYGVTEGVSSSTNGYETVAGKIEHYPHLTSKYGIEQAAGTELIWGSDVGGNYPTTDLAWRDNTDSRGQIYSTSNNPTAVTLGGARDYGVLGGSRASLWSSYVWNSNWVIGCRFACGHLEEE